jgi:hypothetical protein
MKLYLLHTVLVLFSFCCKGKGGNETSPGLTRNSTDRKRDASFAFTFYDRSGSVISPAYNLSTAWQSFVQAIQADNFLLLEKISTDCIACENCGKEDNRFIPIENFLSSYYQSRFNLNLKSRLNDSMNVKAHYDTANLHLYFNQCVSGVKQKNSINIVEFFIKVIEGSNEFEGADVAIAFIETPDGFKFCGYSTVP